MYDIPMSQDRCIHTMQRRRKMSEVGGQGAEGCGIEACSGDRYQSARSAEQIFRLHFSVIRMALVAPSCFVLMHQDQCCKVAEGSLLFIFSDFFPEQIRLSYV